MTQTESTEQAPTEEQLFRAAIVASTNRLIRDCGPDAYLELLEGVGPVHAKVIMEAMDWADARQEAMA